ncbi:hypothetical protein ACFW7J_24270 [Streptomyces sp. NPDC059525]|uniref:hypothetical protein n=1 Tax=Streptomyces sp. NPDC059525 TaxID=3346857 RepID=UPI0036CE894E
MTSRIAHSCAREACSSETSDSTPPHALVIHTPSAELLTRALAGWERFLDTFEEPPHE